MSNQVQSKGLANKRGHLASRFTAILRDGNGTQGWKIILGKSVEAISAVLPLRVFGAGGLYADNFGRCQILLTSLSRFAATDLFETIFVVAPPREFPYVASSAGRGTLCRLP